MRVTLLKRYLSYPAHATADLPEFQAEQLLGDGRAVPEGEAIPRAAGKGKSPPPPPAHAPAAPPIVKRTFDEKMTRPDRDKMVHADKNGVRRK